jgi:hypothetical protein
MGFIIDAFRNDCFHLQMKARYSNGRYKARFLGKMVRDAKEEDLIIKVLMNGMPLCTIDKDGIHRIVLCQPGTFQGFIKSQRL